jgi:aminopeptidase N
LVSWVNGCDQFAPCDNRPDQFATYHFTVTHDASLTVTCPGTLTQDSATQTECDFELAGGPTYSTFGIDAYPAWTQSDEGMWGGVHVTLYDRASTGIMAQIDPTYHSGFLTWMESELGPYPFGTELRVLTAPTYWNGFEHPTNIVLNDTLQSQQRTSPYAKNVAHTLDHEMTHMWAGNQTTLAGTYDFAWKESMAEYLPFVYEAMTDVTNNTAIAIRTAAAWKGMAKVAKYWPVPDDMPTLFDYYGDVYGAGPMVLFRQLEVMTSRAQVLAAIQATVGNTPHSLSIDGVVSALSTATGLDLTAYSAAWIHGTGTPVWPEFSLAYTPGVGSADGSLVVTQTNAATAPRGCKFHVGFYGADASDYFEIAVDTYNNGSTQTLPVPAPAFTVTTTALDPDNECLVFPATTSAVKGVRRNPWVAPRMPPGESH